MEAHPAHTEIWRGPLISDPPMDGPREPMRAQAWLAQLTLLASLPYPVDVLMPSVLYTLRQGIQASFGTFTPLDRRTLCSGSIVTEAFLPGPLRWLCDSRAQAQAEQSTVAMVRSDGESRRLLCEEPAYTQGVLYGRIYVPLRTRWSMVAPLLDAGGAAHGLLYLHRGEADGPFNDAEQALLRRAREALQGLIGKPAAKDAALDPTAPRRPVVRASLMLDERGELVALEPAAQELLYRCAAPGPGMVGWAETSAHALPAQPMDAALAMLKRADDEASDGARKPLAPVRGHGGDFWFSMQRLRHPRGGRRGLAVHIEHREPADLALARRLAHWPLSPQEKRLLTMSVRAPDQYALAEQLGVTLGTLKAYTKDMVRRTGFASRQAMVAGILDGTQPIEVVPPNLH